MSTTIRISKEAHRKLKGFAKRCGFKIEKLGDYLILEGLKTLEGFPSFELIEREGKIFAFRRAPEIVRKGNRYTVKKRGS